MYEKLAPLLITLAAGWAWRRLRPGGTEPAILQRVINTLSMYLLIPAIVMPAVLNSKVTKELFLVPITAWVVFISGLVLAVISYRLLAKFIPISESTQGAMVQAVPQGDTLGIGLVMVVGLYGEEATSVPVMYTLLAAMIYIWTIGVMSARYYGSNSSRFTQLQELVRMPPIWALIIAWSLKLSGTSLPEPIMNTCEMLRSAAIPLIIFAVGLSFSFKLHGRLPIVLPALILRLVVCPGIAFLVGSQLGLYGDILAATVICAASSCFVVGAMIAEQYGLDTELYATTLGLSIPLFIVLAPLYAELMVGL